jgi:hypothetical protein
MGSAKYFGYEWKSTKRKIILKGVQKSMMKKYS